MLINKTINNFLLKVVSYTRYICWRRVVDRDSIYTY